VSPLVRRTIRLVILLAAHLNAEVILYHVSVTG